MNLRTARFVNAILAEALQDPEGLTHQELTRAVINGTRPDIDKWVPALAQATFSEWTDAVCAAASMLEAGFIGIFGDD